MTDTDKPQDQRDIEARAEREAFEEIWIQGHEGGIPGCLALERHSDGGYEDLETQDYWEEWQLACKWQREAARPAPEALPVDSIRDVLQKMADAKLEDALGPHHLALCLKQMANEALDMLKAKCRVCGHASHPGTSCVNIAPEALGAAGVELSDAEISHHDGEEFEHSIQNPAYFQDDEPAPTNKNAPHRGKRYGPYDVAWMGAGVWAGLPDELPPELVGKKVWLVEVGHNYGKKLQRNGTLK